MIPALPPILAPEPAAPASRGASRAEEPGDSPPEFALALLAWLGTPVPPPRPAPAGPAPANAKGPAEGAVEDAPVASPEGEPYVSQGARREPGGASRAPLASHAPSARPLAPVADSPRADAPRPVAPATPAPQPFAPDTFEPRTDAPRRVAPTPAPRPLAPVADVPRADAPRPVVPTSEPQPLDTAPPPSPAVRVPAARADEFPQPLAPPLPEPEVAGARTRAAEIPAPLGTARETAELPGLGSLRGAAFRAIAGVLDRLGRAPAPAGEAEAPASPARDAEDDFVLLDAGRLRRVVLDAGARILHEPAVARILRPAPPAGVPDARAASAGDAVAAGPALPSAPSAGILPAPSPAGATLELPVEAAARAAVPVGTAPARADAGGPGDRHEGERALTRLLRAERRVARLSALDSSAAATPVPEAAVRPAVAGNVPAAAEPAFARAAVEAPSFRAWEQSLSAPRAGEALPIRLEDPDGATGTLRLRMRGETLHASLRTADAGLAARLERDLPALQQALRERGAEQARVQIAGPAAASGSDVSRREPAGSGAFQSPPRPDDRPAHRRDGESRQSPRERSQGGPQR